MRRFIYIREQDRTRSRQTLDGEKESTTFKEVHEDNEAKFDPSKNETKNTPKHVIEKKSDTLEDVKGNIDQVFDSEDIETKSTT